ncbi:DUF4129 domain-containing protein [Paenarthrobacter sp. NPDC092416]|uniref:DUF4129 domain-containing protein n=1 Tax=Paenarthrobacter sp. NPDC092416 TaxID=3364386 RepID=UPI00383009EB
MTASLTHVGLVLGRLEPPVTPDRDEARRWATEELAKPQYPDAEPGWISQLWRDFLDWLGSLQGDGQGPGNDFAVPLIGALAVVLIILTIIFVRPRLNARRKVAADIYDKEPAMDAGAYRRRAAAAADQGNWPAAVVDQFRALVRAGEERDVIEPRAGRTADEAATQLGQVFGSATEQLNRAARMFDGVRYGDQGAVAADFRELQELDAHILAMAPDFEAQHGHGFAVPR